MNTVELSLDDIAAELRAGNRVILLVRHAERPRMDPDDPTFGDALPITDEGVRSSRLFGERLADFGGDVQFYSSPLRRTRMTAATIAAGMGIDGAEVPVDELLGNGSFYYADVAKVLTIFRPENFFAACFEYYATGRLPGFNDLHEATDAFEAWLLERFVRRLFVVVTHDCYIAAFLAARNAYGPFSRENWTRFLDAGAILIAPDGTRRYALVRTQLSNGIVGVPPK